MLDKIAAAEKNLPTFLCNAAFPSTSPRKY